MVFLKTYCLHQRFFKKHNKKFFNQIKLFLDEYCSDCYDFCLPDYAVQRRQKYDDHVTVNIRRLNCFRLYVPEWTKFQVRTDATGGHWEYPMKAQNTQRDSDGEWTNWAPSNYYQQQQQSTNLLHQPQ